MTLSELFGKIKCILFAQVDTSESRGVMGLKIGHGTPIELRGLTCSGSWKGSRGYTVTVVRVAVLAVSSEVVEDVCG